MTTTTQITNIAHKLDLTAYAGDFDGDYDMDAIHVDYVDELNAALPLGIAVRRNGDVIADVLAIEQAHEIDWNEVAEQVDVAAIFERHDKVMQLLNTVERTTEMAKRAERQRVDAVQAAKESGRFTVEEIAKAAGITRDAVYKMLARAEA